MLMQTKVLITVGLGFLLIASIILVTFFVVKDHNNEKVGCQIYPFEVPLPPLVVISGTNTFIYPKHGENVLRFDLGQSVDFICPGRKLIWNKSETTNNNSLLSGTCVSGSTFRIGNTNVHWKNLECDHYPWRTIRYTGNSCEKNGTEIEAGFEVENNRFLRSLVICFNQELQVAYYTYINQIASINQKALDTPRPSFLQGTGFYNIGTVNKLYLRSNQRTTINRLVGLPDNSMKYIQNDTNFFLARGHLTARGDAFYAAQQNATFFYQNVAPQWQTFNGFNWNQIEMDVRDYAEENGVDLQVWTGVHGVTTLPHETTGVPVELYLFVDDKSGRKALPVPEIYWKVAYNPVTERGLALIGINNPYNDTFVTVCNDVSKRITWLHCDRNNQKQGFCYACSIETFRRVVDSLPNISVRGLLL